MADILDLNEIRKMISSNRHADEIFAAVMRHPRRNWARAFASLVYKVPPHERKSLVTEMTNLLPQELREDFMKFVERIGQERKAKGLK